jgi:hypothetical protein
MPITKENWENIDEAKKYFFHRDWTKINYTLLPKYRQLRKDSQSNWFCGHFMNCSTIRIAPYHEETILDYCSWL